MPEPAATESQQGTERVFQTHAPIARILSFDDLTQAAQQAAPDPSVFADAPPFFWRSHISNNGVDAYLTRMAPSTLKNFAAESAAGVSFQNSHNTRQLGFGRSLTGTYIGAQGNGQARVEADFYTVPGLRLNDVSTDDFITGVKAGLIRDVSVGFYGGTMRCSICDGEMYSFFGFTFGECDHIPGVEYSRDDKPDSPKESAVVWIEDAHLAEVSAVYDGATPGAEIIAVKSRALAESGRLRPEVARVVETRYRVKLPTTARAFAGVTTPTEGQRMEDRDRPAAGGADSTVALAVHQALSERFESVRLALRDIVPAETPTDGDADLTVLVRGLGEQIRQLRPLADDGRTYRADLVEQARVEGVRAYGIDFAWETTYKPMLEAADIATIKRMRDDWKAIGDKQFPGGRLSQEAVQPADKPGRRERPAAAFAS